MALKGTGLSGERPAAAGGGGGGVNPRQLRELASEGNPLSLLSRSPNLGPGLSSHVLLQKAGPFILVEEL